MAAGRDVAATGTGGGGPAAMSNSGGDADGRAATHATVGDGAVGGANSATTYSGDGASTGVLGSKNGEVD